MENIIKLKVDNSQKRENKVVWKRLMRYIHPEKLNQLVTIECAWVSFIPVESFVSALKLDNNFVVDGFAIRLSNEPSEMAFAVICSDCLLWLILFSHFPISINFEEKASSDLIQTYF